MTDLLATFMQSEGTTHDHEDDAFDLADALANELLKAPGSCSKFPFYSRSGLELPMASAALGSLAATVTEH